MENKKGGNLICRRPDTIIEARFKLTRRQNDILDMVFACIEDDSNLQYEIDIAKYSQLYNVKDKSSLYNELKKTAETFECKGFSIVENINNNKKSSRTYFAWFASIKYLEGEGKIIFELGQTLKKIMISAKKACFYQLKYSLNFRNIYSKRLYYYLKSFEDTGWRIDNLNILRNKLECPKSYNRFTDFRKYVLDIAHKEINGNSDISFEYEEIKTKVKVTSLKFYIHSNKPNNKAKEKVCATIEGKHISKGKGKATEPIKAVKAILAEENISDLEAKKLLDTANGNIEIIKDKYSQAQKVIKIDSVVGWMLKAIKENYQAPKSKSKNGDFNNYEQRDYDFDKLEKKLLGWDNEEKIPSTGEEFEQSNLKNIIAVQ